MDIKTRLLNYYNLSEIDLKARQIDRPLSFIKDPFKYFNGFSKTISYLKECIKNKTKIVIYGDYDVDGMTSTSILVLAFKKLNIDVGYFIPSRYNQGYGLTKQMIDQFYQKGYKLIITVDNGISKFDEIEYAKSLNIDVVIIDHHEIVENKLPNTNYIIHQKVGKYTTYNISAAFLAMLVYYGLVGEYDEYIVSLAGIAVISDMMEVTDMNLLILKHAINSINKLKFKQFNLLLYGSIDGFEIKDNKAYYLSNLLNYPINSGDISYKIVPLLNSLGRVNISYKNNNGVRFLLCEDDKKLVEYYNFIKQVNTSKIETIKKCKENLKYDYSSSKIAIQIIDDIPIGLIGGIVNDYIFKTNKNAILFAYKDELKQELVGSGRSISGFDIYSALLPLKDKFLAFGGHPFAFGLSIKACDFENIKQEIINQVEISKPCIELKTYIKLDINELSRDLFDIVEEFEPFGYGFTSPIFYVEMDKSLFKLSMNKLHLLYKNDKGISLNYFNFDQKVNSNQTLKLTFNISKSIFRNQIQYSFNVIELVNDKTNYKLIY